MNKEMIEIMDIKEELNTLKTKTEEEISKITKKIKDNKAEEKKLIETKFEEILNTVNFSVINSPGMSKSDTKQIKKTVEKIVEECEKDRNNEIDELTKVVEDIADKFVEENNIIKSKIKDLENGGTNPDVENAILNTNKIVKVLEQELKENTEKNKEKISKMKELQAIYFDKIELIQSQVDEILGKNKDSDNGELSEQIVVLDKKYQGEKLEISEEIKNIKEQLNNLKDKIITENEIDILIDEKVEKNEYGEKGLEGFNGKFNELREIQKKQEEKLGQIEGMQIVQNEKAKQLEENEKIVKQVQEKIENLENSRNNKI